MEDKYYNQIMTKNEMSIEEAEKIIDDMYQDKYKIMEQKTEQGVVIDVGKMDKITLTNLEFASVRALREIQSLRYKLEKQEKENKELKYKLQNVKNYIENEIDIVDNPTICGDEEDTITELPISLNLYNEDLRELLELLED